MEKKSKRMKRISSQTERLEAERQFQELYEAIQADFDQISEARQRQKETEQRSAIEHGKKYNWSRMEFETLNTQMKQYKKTLDSQIFRIMWHDHLKKLTHQYLHDFIIKGMPEMARRLFLTDTKAEELQDMLYPVLLQAIRDWEPDDEHRFTKDFAAFYKKAVEYERGNILRKFNSKCNRQVSLQYLDFNNDEEVNVLLMNEPNLAIHLGDQSNIEQAIMKWHVSDFVQNCLTQEEKELFRMFYEEQRTVMEMAKVLQVTRMTVYRRMEKVNRLWAEFNQYND